MKPPTSADFNFRTGVILDADHAILLAGNKELDAEKYGHTCVFGWTRDGEWTGEVLEWTSTSMCLGKTPVDEVIILGEDGEFLGLGMGTERTEGFVLENETVASVNEIAGRPHVVGMLGVGRRRMAAAQWDDLGFETDASYEAIAGYDDKNYCAVGWQGAILMVEDGVARAVSAPSNVILTRICAGANGYYYASGQDGVLLRGKGDAWELIDHGGPRETFWDVQWFQGKLYVSSIHFVYVLTDEDLLERVYMADAAIVSAYHLHTRDDSFLLSVGDRDVVLFDGNEWTRII